MKKTEYGDGSDTAYFKWEKNDKGDYELKETNQNEAQITVHYDESNNKRKEITSTGQSVNQEFVNVAHDVTSTNSQGGAIYNSSRNNTHITSDFISNEVKGNPNGRGGAIYNDLNARIDSIIGDFIGNFASGDTEGCGGAIDNVGTITSIEGDFIGNFALGDHQGYGGAVFNNATIESIDGDFINNYAKGGTNGNGGAIFNTGTINSIQGDFKNNYIEGNETKGGGIFNDNGETIENINGDFISNHAQATESAYGGAVVNTGTINSIEGDFIDNYAQGKKGCGGAIFNDDESFYNVVIKSINGNFSGNKALGDEQGLGGAIYNDEGTIEKIIGKFSNNMASNKGGAVFNENNAKIGDITGDFIKNYAKSDLAVHGGAIYNYKSSSIGNIEGSFIGNYSSTGVDTSHGGAIDNCNSIIGDIKGDFIENYSEGSNDSYGGSIYNYNTEEDLDSKIGNLTGDFVKNYVKASGGNAIGGAIYNNLAEIGNIEGDFYSNSAESTSAQGKGGAIANDGTMGYVSGNFVSNSASSLGGAIYNTGTMGTFKNTSFIKNSAGSQGGAIYTTKDITIEADGKNIVFSGNTAGGKQEAIYVADAAATVTMSAKGGETYLIDDQIDGLKGYGLKFEGSGSSKLVLNNKISNANIKYEGYTADIAKADYLTDNNSLDVESGTINFGNFGTTQLNFRNFTFKDGEININNSDVDLEKQVMGRITADEYGEAGSGVLTLKGLTVIKDKEADEIPVFFADSSFANGVNIDVTEAQGPVFKYAVTYSNDGSFNTSSVKAGGGNEGYVVFTRTDYNPAVQATSIAQLAGVYSAVMQSFEYSFEHADTFSALPASVRKAKLNDNKYAINEAVSLPSYYNELTKKSMWFRPYTTFENVPLKNGPKVSNVVYGSYAGGDSEIIPLKNGWSTVYTGYVGYNGSHQSFDGNSTYQNGVILGATDTFYKDAFYTALTMSVGTSFGETSTSFGNEDFTMLYGGVASKTGYNFEFNDGRFIIQPNLLLAYTFINTFDYTNAAGVKIDSEPLHSLQVNPHVKFILNTQSGWQPYLTGGFVYNVMGQSQVKAVEGPNVYSLPAVSIKPYAEYGVGIQKLWDDKYTGFLQAMVRSGGRNGVAFVTGFRWALGDDNKVEKVQKPDKNIKTVSNVTKTEKSKKVKTEKPAEVKVEKPVKVETPAVLKTTEKVEKPAKVELEKSAKVKAEKTVKVETKVPEKVQTNEVILKTDVIQTPVKTEASAKVETPAKIKTETLTKTQQPEREEHHSFIYNWMLNFSNFFALPAEKRTAKK